MDGTTTSTCMELALEGERLCKTGDFQGGVAFFEAAIKVGTNDQRTLSAIYSQLGNAYFYLEKYEKALEYHKLDVATTKNIHDDVAEAKASGNLGNTLKMLDKFDEAAEYCLRHLEISRNLGDKVGEGRALYNLGNVYHTKGKKMLHLDRQDPGELTEEVKACLLKAVEYYEANLSVAQELKDDAAMGRAYGNLGNTHYLIGNFQLAVLNHEKRLEIARRFGDRAAERRAQCNLGNANVFLKNFQEALENYFQTLHLAQELDDKTVEAQSFYSLANTYTMLHDYESAIKYHHSYLDMVKKLKDRLGESRACWSLVNVYQLKNDHHSALEYAKKHLEIAKELGDEAGQESAQINIQAILLNKQTHNNNQADGNQVFTISGALIGQGTRSSSVDQTSHQTTKNKRFSMERLNLFRLTPDKRQEQEQRRFEKQLNCAFDPIDQKHNRKSSNEKLNKSASSERLLDMIAHFQSGRIDEQRCEIIKNNQGPLKDDKENLDPPPKSSGTIPVKQSYRKSSLANYPCQTEMVKTVVRRPTVSAEHRDQLFELIAGAQGQRMDEQRASLPRGKIAANGTINVMNNKTQATQPIDGSSFTSSSQEVLSSQKNHNERKVSVGKKPLSRRYQSLAVEPQSDERFLDLLMKCQSTRLDDQRVAIPKTSNLNAPPKSDINPSSSVKKQSDKFQKRSSSVCLSGLTTASNEMCKQRSRDTEDDFFNLIMRFQSDRIDDQRSALPSSSSDHQMSKDKGKPRV